ncbi:MAG: ATP-binding protein [Pseudomonadota bacterium]
MTVAPSFPANERQRLIELHACEVLDTEADPAFDDIVELAAEICEVPIALISLVDHDRQWFKARVGLEAEQTSRDVSFCGHAILTPEQLMQVEDATRDSRFRGNPLVTGEPGIRFYAGAPLVSTTGSALGTLCVIDREPRRLSDFQNRALSRLAGQATQLLEALSVNRALQESNDDLMRFAISASHDMQAPLQGIRQLAEFIKADVGETLPKESLSHLTTIVSRADRMLDSLRGLLLYSRIGTSERVADCVSTDDVLTQAAELALGNSDFRIERPEAMPNVFAPHAIVELVFRNLLENAVKHHDKARGQVTVSWQELPTAVEISFCDDGPGIDATYADRVFEIFETLQPKSRGGGSGIGLALVRRAINKAGGSVAIEPRNGRGACFVTVWPKP